MNEITTTLQNLFSQIPRRHNDENVKEINNLIEQFEDILIEIEAINSYYEKKIPPFFDTIEVIKSSVKKSTDRKASKKNKDNFFDEASGDLKENIEKLIEMYGNGLLTD